MQNSKIFFCFLIIIISSKSIAQPKFSFGLNYSYLENYRVFTYHESGSYIDERNHNEKNKKGFYISGIVSYSINKNIFLESGIGYSEIGYQSIEYSRINASTLKLGSFLYVFDYHNINMPIHVVYSTNRKLNFVLSFGPSLVYLLCEDIDFLLRDEYGNPDGQRDSDYPFERENNFRKLNTSIDLGIGIGYKLINKIRIEFQPKISYFLFSNENTWAKKYIYASSINYPQNKKTKENFYSVGVSFKILFTPGKKQNATTGNEGYQICIR